MIRLMLLFSFPNLSDDIFRFIWDGRMCSLGINPYGYLPSEIVDNHAALGAELYSELNSPNYFTI